MPRVNSPKKQGRDIQREIARVLLQEWDPIGVRGRPELADEYDRYTGRVYRLLTSNPSAREVAEHLLHVESEAFGVSAPGGADSLLAVAEKILEIDVRIH